MSNENKEVFFSDIKKQIVDNVNSFSIHLGKLPELSSALVDSINHPGFSSKIFRTYINLTQDLLDPGKIAIMNIVNSQINHKKAAEGKRIVTENVFGKEMNQKQRESFSHLLKSLKPFSLEHKQAIEDLAYMMTNGHNIAQKALENGIEVKPVDGDPIWDVVIWGHTQIANLNPKPFIHFTACHFIERSISNFLEYQGVKKPKDFFLNWMTNALLLDVAQYGEESKYHEVYKLWKLPKDKGGLGWISFEREEMFNQIVNTPGTN